MMEYSKKNIEMAINDTDKYLSLGRNLLCEKGLALFWTGSGIEFNIASECLYVNIESDYDQREIMIDIIIDKERSQKFILSKGRHKYMVYSGMNSERPVNVRILRDTQCMPDETKSYVVINSIEYDGCGCLCDAPEYSYNIEFIGDSLTSGEGCGLTKREEWNSVVFDAVDCYTYKTADILNAYSQVISESGWGLYASYDADYDHALSKYYNQICGTTGCSICKNMGAHGEWDFSKVEMDAVVINLGTNDGTAMKADESKSTEFISGFKKRAVEFLGNIRKRNGSCFIVWAYGMLGLDMEEYIKEAIEEYKSGSGDTRVEYFRMPACTEKEDLGARYHPTPKAHEKAAKSLADYLQSLQAFLLR